MGSLQELPDPPSDPLTGLRWSHDGNALVVGSWGRDVRVYQRNADDTFSLRQAISTEVPRLDVCWGKPGADVVYFVGVDGEVREYDFNTDTQTLLSAHEKSSNKVAYSTDHNLLISTSWDETMHVHDADSRAFIRVRLATKPFALSLIADRVVVAMANRKVSIYDLAALRALVDQTGNTSGTQDVLEVQPWQERDSSLKFMTRAVACMPDGTGFATSSIEGRVSVEWFDPALEQNTYAFKCHRQVHTLPDGQGNEEEVDVVYPVNAIAFHPSFGTFATGGGDGVVALWDAKSKRRVKLYPALDVSVSAVDITRDGHYLAIATNPGVEESVLTKPKDDDGGAAARAKAYLRDMNPLQVKIFVRKFGDGEAKAKEKKAK